MNRCLRSSFAVGRCKSCGQHFICDSYTEDVTHMFRVSLQTLPHKVPERLGERLVQNRWRVSRNEEQDLHWMWINYRSTQTRTIPTFIGCRSAYGGSPFAISMSVIPSGPQIARWSVHPRYTQGPEETHQDSRYRLQMSNQIA